MSMTSMKWALIVGLGAFAAGLVLTQLEANLEIIRNCLFLVAVVMGLIQLVVHIRSLNGMEETPLFFKIITIWFLVAFGLISGYVITIACMLTASGDFAALLRSRSRGAPTNAER